MSKITIASAASILTLSSAMAEVSQPIAVPVAQPADLSYAFDDNQNLQIKAMTQQEMDNTEGAVAPIAAYGIRMGVMGTIGVGANAWNHYSNTGKFSWGAAGRGFVAGAIGGGAAKYLGGRGW